MDENNGGYRTVTQSQAAAAAVKVALFCKQRDRCGNCPFISKTDSCTLYGKKVKPDFRWADRGNGALIPMLMLGLGKENSQ
jgi:hypothetical protein